MSTDIELEPYREVIDIMAARIKRAEQHNTYLSEGIFECQKRVERLNAELENVASKSSLALTQAQIAELERDKARLDWIEAHALAQHSHFVSISNLGRYYNGFPGSLRAAIDASRERNTRSGHDPAKSGQAAEAAIDAKMKAMTPAPLDDFQNDNSYDLQDDNP